MPAYEVSRTLVKSAPEVWSELERVERLAELLGDGTIEIVSKKDENLIEWRGERASGTIEIAASGWGTKVKLTAQAEEIAVAEEVAVVAEEVVTVAEDVIAVAEEVVDDVEEVVAAETASDEAAIDDATEDDETDAPISTADADQPVKRQGFWKRLFSGSRGETEEPDPSAGATDVESPPEPESPVEPDPPAELTPPVELAPPVEPESPVELASPVESEAPSEPEPPAEPEPVDYESLLAGVLDHLGSAHKRPFTHA